MNDKKNDKKQVEKLEKTAKRLDDLGMKAIIDKKIREIKAGKPVNKNDN